MGTQSHQAIFSSHRDDQIAHQTLPTSEDPHSRSSMSQISDLAGRDSEYVAGVNILDFAASSTGLDASDNHDTQITNSEYLKEVGCVRAIQSSRTLIHTAAFPSVNPSASTTKVSGDGNHTPVQNFVDEKPVFGSCYSAYDDDCLKHIGERLPWHPCNGDQVSTLIAGNDPLITTTESRELPVATVSRHSDSVSSTKMVDSANVIGDDSPKQTEIHQFTDVPEKTPSLVWGEEQERKLAALGVTGMPKPVVGYIPLNAVPYYSISDIDIHQHERTSEFVASTRSVPNSQTHPLMQQRCSDTTPIHETRTDVHSSSQNHRQKRIRSFDHSTSVPAPKRSRCFIDNRGAVHQSQERFRDDSWGIFKNAQG